MPVTLAMLAIERSISAQRMTKVSPTAMIAGHRHLGQDVADIVDGGKGRAGDGEEGEQQDQRQERRDIAHLGAQEGSDAALACGLPGLFHCSPSRTLRYAASSRRSLLTASPTNSRTTAPRFITRIRSASDSTVSGSVDSTMIAEPLGAQVPDDIDHVVLGADIHAARRLAQHEQPRRIGQPFRQRHLLLIAAGKHAEVEADDGRPDLQLLDLPPARSPARVPA